MGNATVRMRAVKCHDGVNVVRHRRPTSPNVRGGIDAMQRSLDFVTGKGVDPVAGGILSFVIDQPICL